MWGRVCLSGYAHAQWFAASFPPNNVSPGAITWVGLVGQRRTASRAVTRHVERTRTTDVEVAGRVGGSSRWAQRRTRGATERLTLVYRASGTRDLRSLLHLRRMPRGWLRRGFDRWIAPPIGNVCRCPSRLSLPDAPRNMLFAEVFLGLEPIVGGAVEAQIAGQIIFAAGPRILVMDLKERLLATTPTRWTDVRAP